jgi:hypothetical protein
VCDGQHLQIVTCEATNAQTRIGVVGIATIMTKIIGCDVVNALFDGDESKMWY